MKNYIYLVITAAIYFSLKEGFELHGIGWTLVCGAIAGGVVGAIAWCTDKIKTRRKENKEFNNDLD